MPNYISIPVVVFILGIIMLATVEVAVYGVQNNKANDIAQEMTKEIELLGKIDSTTYAAFEKKIADRGLKPERFKLLVTEEKQYRWKEKFSIQVSGYYPITVFNFMNLKQGIFKLPIKATDSGVTEVLVR